MFNKIYSFKVLKPNVKIQLIKEKWGCLRIHTSTYNKESQELIEIAENRSDGLCFYCGNQGKIVEMRGYYLPYCDACIVKQTKH